MPDEQKAEVMSGHRELGPADPGRSEPTLYGRVERFPTSAPIATQSPKGPGGRALGPPALELEEGQWSSGISRVTVSSDLPASTPTSGRSPADKRHASVRSGWSLLANGATEWWATNNFQTRLTSLPEDAVASFSDCDASHLGLVPPPMTGHKKTGFCQSGIFACPRRKACQGRMRYQWDGFDLDLTYITERVIAMGFPCAGWERVFRNPRNKVRRFLNWAHPGHYRIYNLCGEDGYRHNGFPEHTVCFPSADHCPPALTDMVAFCQDADKWLRADAKNIIVVHCKAGKGRSGSVVCALLVYCKAAHSAHEALVSYGDRRGGKHKGVTIPSQIRWIAMFEHLVRYGPMGLCSDPMDHSRPAPTLATEAAPLSPILAGAAGAEDCGAPVARFGPFRLRAVRLGPLQPNITDAAGGMVVSVALTTREAVAEKKVPGHRYPDSHARYDAAADAVDVPLPDDGPVWTVSEGMATIRLQRKDARGPTLKVTAWFHHAFMELRRRDDGGVGAFDLVLDLPKMFVDMAREDQQSDRVVPEDFRLRLTFEDLRERPPAAAPPAPAAVPLPAASGGRDPVVIVRQAVPPESFGIATV